MKENGFQTPPPTDYTDASRGDRLQKVMASAGVASRRECEELIRKGAVTVNGVFVTELPAWVDGDRDHVCVDGIPIAKTTTALSNLTYVILHKPRNVITTTDDPHDRRSVLDLVDLPEAHAGVEPPRLYPVGRLDADSSGLILLTNDGEIAHRLTHPSFEVSKRYEVSVRGRITDTDVEDLKQGLFLAHKGIRGRAPSTRKARMSQVRLLGYQRDRINGDRTKLSITLQEGQNREIRRLLAKLRFKVRRLKRVEIGPLSVKGLAVSQWRYLTTAEVNQLRSTVGLKPMRKSKR